MRGTAQTRTFPVASRWAWAIVEGIRLSSAEREARGGLFEEDGCRCIPEPAASLHGSRGVGLDALAPRLAGYPCSVHGPTPLALWPIQLKISHPAPRLKDLQKLSKRKPVYCTRRRRVRQDPRLDCLLVRPCPIMTSPIVQQTKSRLF